MASKKAKSLRRRAGTLEQRSRFLVYAEGSVTEEIYIRGARADLGRVGPNIEIGSTHGEPLKLVRDAVRHQEREYSQGDAFNQVWCVFDVESPEPHGSLNEAIELADRNNIRCGITNPCFELWLILHFEECHGWLTTDDACRHLEYLPCGYDKDTKRFDYSRCRGLQQTATDRADALDAACDRSVPIRDRNPWASVQELFRELRRARAA
jgi:RloB-like protein